MPPASPVRSWTRRGSLLAAMATVSALTAAAALPDVARAGAATGARSMYLIGDSWAAGLFADSAHALGQVAAQNLGWPITVDAVSGTGYLNVADAQTFLQRATAAVGGPQRLVIVQGGSNDDELDHAELSHAVTATIETLRQRFPAAAILLLGPGPDPAPVTDVQVQTDRTIGAAADAAGATYISMLAEGWIPEAHVDSVIDPATQHPTVRGQEYLGLRLAASIRLLLPEVLAD